MILVHQNYKNNILKNINLIFFQTKNNLKNKSYITGSF